MKVADVIHRIEEIKNETLAAMDVPEEAIAEIKLADAPDPEMGDVGFPCFVLARHLRNAPQNIAKDVAEKIRADYDEDVIAEVNPVGPYVNFKYDQAMLATIVVGEALDTGEEFGAGVVDDPEHVMIEYSAPNTNKPQHLGHVRNDLLGASVASIMTFAGNDVTRVNLINDRGIHICKSMLAYQLWGTDDSPEASGMKGDHFVGKYYVLFGRMFAQEYEAWQETDEADAKFQGWLAEQSDDKKEQHGEDELRSEFFDDYEDDFFNEESELGAQAKKLLRSWEAGDAKTVELWNEMNSWVFRGFDETYERLGVGFERVYRESETYLLGKDVVLRGVEEGKFEKLDDGAVICDLEEFGLQGQKVLLRSDGTSVYMTQDLGTALARFDEYDIDRLVYVVGDEQNYHFRVLFDILGLVEPSLKGRLYHLSYGMIDLPSGRMKTREGTVVDADDMMDEMEELAEEAVRERYDDLSEDEVAERSRVIGLAALKYFILDYNPGTSFVFDPEKSISFEGRTGPYCLYSYARIESIREKMGGWPELDDAERTEALSALGTDLERDVIHELQAWPDAVRTAVDNHDPSKVTEHIFKLCKTFSTLYNDADHRIRDIEGPRRDGLLLLSKAVASTVKSGLRLLGIETLEQM